ncbi:helix-turn-helix domain-containing protein [Cryptosporangium sp. NPDC048952]|uniref:helix-turn-helix domain-containing protein n=1 Tax=Cryptosporangium sp. NPDC048952 TaxID=3363961 RepID=UPI00371E6AA5
MIGTQIARLRHAKGLTQEALAEAAGVSVDVVRRLEQGQRDTARISSLKAIAAALGSDLALIFTPKNRQGSITQSSVDSGGASDLPRRDILRLIALATAALGIDPDRLSAHADRAEDHASLAQLATVNKALWSAFSQATNKAAAGPAVDAHLDRLTTALGRPQQVQARQEIYALTADAFQLAGEIAFDSDRYNEAAHCYTLAATAAREGDAADLWACALTRHAYLSIYERQFTTAVPLLRLAAQRAQTGDSRLATRHWVAAVTAQALAGTRDRAGCDRALVAAERVHELDLTAAINGGWLRFDGTRLSEDRAACYLQLGRPTDAEPLLTQMLHDNPTGRRRGIALADLALVGAQRRDPLRVVTFGSASLDHYRHTGSSVVGRRLQQLRPHLIPMRSDPHIRNLDAELRALPATAV